MSNLIGQSLGRYQIFEQLGEGGMATVYKAHDTRLDRTVAVKVIRQVALPPQHLDRILKRFRREAQVLASLSHPNIVKVLDYGEHDNAPYLVLEFQPSGTLKSTLVGPVPWQETIRLLVPIVRALDYAHRMHFVHRDVKPSNILMSIDGQPMLTDFGIVKLLETDQGGTLSTGTGVGLGTPEYMAPEQALGQNVDVRADIYSLGVVFYEMITGRKPFQADTPMAVVVKQINEPLPRPSGYVQELPEVVDRFLVKALAKKPQDRFQSMGQVMKAMERMPQQSARIARYVNTSIDRKRSPASLFRGTNTAHSDAPTAFFEPAPRKGISWILVIGAIMVGILFAGIVGLRSQATSAADTLSNSSLQIARASTDTAAGAVNVLSGARTDTPTQNPTPIKNQIQSTPLLQTPSILSSPTFWPGSIMMTYGESANGQTQGVYTFHAEGGDIVAISVYPEIVKQKNIYGSLILKNGNGETMAVGKDVTLAYEGGTWSGFISAGSRIERYIIPSAGNYYIIAGHSPRGVTQGNLVVVLSKLDK